MTILKQQTSQHTEEQLTLFPADFPASLSAKQAKEKARKMTAGSGMKCFEQYERFRPAGLSLKMFTESLLKSEAWYSSKCRLIWKMQGTRYNRLLFRLVPSMHRTGATEFGLLPTAQTQGLKVCSKQGKTEFVKFELLPTPTASGEESYETRAKRHGHEKAVSYLSSFVQFKTGTTSQLSPLFVAEMMGFPTDWTVLPFLNGAKRA